MLNIVLGSICLAAAVALLMALRARGDEPHPLMQRAGMDVVVPLVILSIMVAGIALVINGGHGIWGAL